MALNRMEVDHRARFTLIALSTDAQQKNTDHQVPLFEMRDKSTPVI